MSGQIRYSDEFKIDTVAQVTECGYPVKEAEVRRLKRNWRASLRSAIS